MTSRTALPLLVAVALATVGDHGRAGAQEVRSIPTARPSSSTVLAGAAAGGGIAAAAGAVLGFAGGGNDGFESAGAALLAAGFWAVGVPVGAALFMEDRGFQVNYGRLVAVSLASTGLGVLGILAVDQLPKSPTEWDCQPNSGESGSTICSVVRDQGGPSDWAYVAAGVGVHLVSFVLLGRYTASRPAADEGALLIPTIGTRSFGLAVRLPVR